MSSRNLRVQSLQDRDASFGLCFFVPAIDDRPQTAQPDDTKYWDEVEDAVETLQEERAIEAILLLRDVIKRSPRNHYAYHFLGVALFETREAAAARDAYRAALALAPQYLGARLHLSHVLRVLGDDRGALEHAEIARRQAPDDPEVFHALGLAYAQRGDELNARRYLEAFLHSNPEFEVSVEVRAALQALGPQREHDEDDEDPN